MAMRTPALPHRTLAPSSPATASADPPPGEDPVRAGPIPAAQAAQSPLRNLIPRAIGSQATVEADIQSHRPQPNDVYPPASDGLTHQVEDEEISKILAAIPKPPAGKSLTVACEALITAANRNGGRDNITVLLVAVTPDLAPA